MGVRGSKPGERRGGRQKGTPNKVHHDIKTMLRVSLDKVGGVAYLVKLSASHPAAYAALLGKLMPTIVDAKVDQTVTVSIEERRAKARELIEAAFSGIPPGDERHVH